MDRRQPLHRHHAGQPCDDRAPLWHTERTCNGDQEQVPYDEIASKWDFEHPIAPRGAENVKRLLSAVRGAYTPHVLDLGCGTGRVLDLKVAAPERYAGSSQAMLNLLVRKHPKIAAVYPIDVREALSVGVFTPGQFDWVFLDSAVELRAEDRAQVEQIARLAVITVDEGQWVVEEASTQRTFARFAL